MGLQCRNGHYCYTTSHRVNGRVKSEYRGSGSLAIFAYQLDQLERQEALEAKRQRQAQWQEERDAVDALDQAVDAVCEEATAAFRTVMGTAGYHQHARGQWRKKRQEKQEEKQDGD